MLLFFDEFSMLLERLVSSLGNLLFKNGDLSPSRDLNPVELTPEITPVTSSLVVPAVSTQASTFPATPRRLYTFPAAHE